MSRSIKKVALPSENQKARNAKPDRKPLPKKNSSGRPCSVCSHKEAKNINSLINERKSFRYISLQFGMSAMSVQRHNRNCLRLKIQALSNVSDSKPKSSALADSAEFSAVEIVRRRLHQLIAEGTVIDLALFFLKREFPLFDLHLIDEQIQLLKESEAQRLDLAIAKLVEKHFPTNTDPAT